MQRTKRLRPAAVAALLIAIGAIRMATTWRTFSATADEATHVGAGLELLQFHRYILQRENPPLPALTLAVAPWLGGMRFSPAGTFTDQIHSVFYDHGTYKENLVRGRVATILFFVVAAVALFFTARDALGDPGALMALLLFSAEPVVLGYSALATHDGAGVAGLAVALFAFARWLRRPDMPHALLFGAAFGFSIDCKFSSIAFVPVACAAMAAVRLTRDASSRRPLARGAVLLAPAALATLAVVWAGYAFTVGTLGELAPWHDAFGGAMQQLIDAHPSAPLPASDFFVGVAVVIKGNAAGVTSFLRGQTSTSGWWWYFPFAAAMKTTIPALLLFAGGALVALRDRALRGVFAEWTAGAMAIIAVVMPSSLDLGLRYALPFYIPFAIAAAASALAMLRASRASAAVAVVLLVGHLGASAFAHPDYFPYFNAFAGRDPSRYLIDSNLDWGQDVLRLRAVARREHIDTLSISVMGAADYVALAFPPVYSANPWAPSHGWVAVSDHSYRMTGTQAGWRWLPDKYLRVGKSIRLYHIP